MRSFAEVCELVVRVVLSRRAQIEVAPAQAAPPRGLHLAMLAPEAVAAPPHAAHDCRVPGEMCLDICGERFQDKLSGAPLDSASFEGLRDAGDNPLALCDFAQTCLGARRAAREVSSALLQPSAAVGAYLATMAQLESGCVLAFEELANDLGSHGAPDELVERARVAASEERVHVVLIGRLAMRHGATPHTAARHRRPMPRSLAAFACRNAAEGCGAEAFNALAITWAAHTARDLSMRSLARHLAADEARHTDLARDVHAWVTSRLPAKKAARLREIRERAIRGAAREPAPWAVQSALGVPSPEVSEHLAEHLIAELGE